MKTRSFLSLTAGLIVCLSQAANAWMDIDTLRAAVETFAVDALGEEFGRELRDGNATIKAAQLDSRLRLSQCDQPLAFKLQRPSHGMRNLTVKTACAGNGKRWAIYVPVTVDIYSDVLVIARSVNRGQILSQDDLTTQRINIAAAGGGHITDISRALGMETARALRPGDTVKLSNLREPKVVQKGDSVVLRAKTGGLTVATSGIALAAGSVGTKIRVQNDRSKRVVNARVMGPGVVSVAER